MLLRYGLLLLVFCFSASAKDKIWSVSLREELFKWKLDVSRLQCDLDRRVNNWTMLDDDKLTLIASMPLATETSMTNKLEICLFDKKQNSWLEKSFNCAAQYLSSQGEELGVCGSLNELHYSDNFIYIEMHDSPSSGPILVLTKNLQYHDAFFAPQCNLAKFHDESMLYQNHQIHFAPWPHAEQLSIYDPYQKSHRQVFPPQASALRQQQIRKFQKAIDRDRALFLANNANTSAEESFDAIDYKSLVASSFNDSVAFIDNLARFQEPILSKRVSWAGDGGWCWFRVNEQSDFVIGVAREYRKPRLNSGGFKTKAARAPPPMAKNYKLC